MSGNEALDNKILTYAYKHNGSQRDLLTAYKQLKARSVEDILRSLSYLEEEKFLVSDPQIWKLTAKGEAAAFAIEISRKKHLYLLLLCVPLCVIIVLIILAKNF